MNEPRTTPMRVQLKMDDGTEDGCWLTMLTGFVEKDATQAEMDESIALVRAVQEKP